ncbi:MAG TPA: ATP-binding protein [Bryobacteraceae bacterium]|nr:ATP-binding protein [Bryobacteraceae bacterium]
MLKSIRSRLTLWYVFIFGLLLIIFSAEVQFLLAGDLAQRFDDSLLRSARATANYFSEFAEKNRVEAGAQETVRDLQLGAARPAILQADRILASSDPAILAAIQSTRILEAARARSETVLATDSRRGARLACVPLIVGGISYQVVMLEPLAELNNQLTQMRRVFFLGIPLALLLASGGGFLMAGKSLRPMVGISSQTEQITAQNLSARVEVTHPGDEVGRLAKVINALLGRLEASFRVMRDFMADASHELRTPLAIIQGEADVTLSQERGAAEYRKSLELIREQARRTSRIVSDMLVLARADAGQQTVRFEEIYLNDLVEECCGAARGLADRAGVQLVCEASEDVAFYGDAELLKRMTLNLVDNAIRYTPTGGSVQVRLLTGNGAARLVVSDTGIGIPAASRSRIFDRFYRGEDANQRAHGGSGLGLSIVKVAAESHRGSVALTSESGHGTTFTVTLPLH